MGEIVIEISGYSKIEINANVNDAIDSIYKESIKIDKDKTNPRSAEIFKAIDFLIRYFCDVTNSTGKCELNIVVIDGMCSSQDYLNASDSKFYIEGVDAINALYERFEEFHEVKMINNETYDCYDKYLEKPDNEYREKANKVKSALEYLVKHYPYFVNGISLQEEETNNDLEDYDNTINYELARAKFFYQKEMLDIENAIKYPQLYSPKKPIIRFKNKQKEVKNIKNYWEVLCLPLHTPLKNIKAAFVAQVEIAKLRMREPQSIDDTYVKRLAELNDALVILSDPYLRYAHTCKLEGKKAINCVDYMESIKATENNSQDKNSEENDFGPNGNKKFLEYIANILEQLHDIKISDYNKLDKKAYEELISSLKYNYDELSKKINEQKETVLSLGCK